MIQYPRLAFVAARDVGAAVRLDINTLGEVANEETWPEHDGFSLGAPSFEGGPGAVGAEYGYRRASFGLVIHSDKFASAGIMSRLARELMRPGGNWLFFKLSAGSPPMWLRTWQTGPGALSFEHLYSAEDDSIDRWGIDITLDADAWLYGERVTLPAQTIGSDSPKRFTLPEIKGDAPTPARCKFRMNFNRPGKRSLITATRGVTIVPIGTSDGLTAGTDTGAAVTDSTAVGGSYRSVSFSTNASLVNRLAGNVTVTPGRYMVLARVRRAATTGTFSLQLRVDAGASETIDGDVVTAGWDTSPSTNHAAWVPLGEFTLPVGAAGVPEDAEQASTPAAAYLYLYASRLTGTSALHLDSLALVPVETESRALYSELAGRGPTTDGYDLVFDGESESYYTLLASNGTLVSQPVPTPAGYYPMLHPGRANEIAFFDQTSLTRAQFLTSASTSDVMATDVRLEVSYRPRWLWLAAI